MNHIIIRMRILAFIPFLLFTIILAVISACDNSPTDPELEQPVIFIDSIFFSGDSTGIDSTKTQISRESLVCREENKGEPYCEVTISWIPPEADSDVFYSIYRSIRPGIESGCSAEDIVGATTDTIFIDSDSLEWGAKYYYAICGLTSDSTILWSDEVFITMPNSQFPTPSVLTAEDLPLGGCTLSWSECPDDDFESYTLVCLMTESSLNADTLGVFSEIQETTFSDSVPACYSPRYYKVITRDTQGLTVESNMIEYTSGFGLPWYIRIYNNCSYEIPLNFNFPITSSTYEDYIYYVEVERNPEERIDLARLYTENGSYTDCFIGNHCDISNIPQQNCMLVSRTDKNSVNYIELRDEASLVILDSRTLPFRTNGILALPTGGKALLHPQWSSQSIVLDISTMELVDTLDYAFTSGQVIEGHGTYIMGEGPLRRINPSTLQVAATSTFIPMRHVDLMVSSSGALCFISISGHYYELDPQTLSTFSIKTLPLTNNYVFSLIEAQGTVYAYLCRYSEPESIKVYNTETLDYVGHVQSEFNLESHYVSDMITLHSRNEIWCVFFDISQNKAGAFCISD